MRCQCNPQGQRRMQALWRVQSTKQWKVAQSQLLRIVMMQSLREKVMIQGSILCFRASGVIGSDIR